MAERLLALGANLNTTTGYGGDQTPLDMAPEVDTGRQALVAWLQERGATSAWAVSGAGAATTLWAAAGCRTGG